jgi:hypothetical protein
MELGAGLRRRRQHRNFLSECNDLPFDELLGVRLTAGNQTAWNGADANKGTAIV